MSICSSALIFLPRPRGAVGATMHYNKGDKLNYFPRAIDTDKPVHKGTVEMFQARGEIFNQDMVSIKEVNHWIPSADCKPINK